MRRELGAKIFITLTALSLLLASCSLAPASLSTDETSESPAVTNETKDSSVKTEATSETSAAETTLPAGEQELIDRYNTFAKNLFDRLIPCGEGDEAAEVLRSVPGVKMVGKKQFYEDKEYLIFFEQPLDHKDPSCGTFIQTVYVCFEGKDAPNCFYIDGYDLGFLQMESQREDDPLLDAMEIPEELIKEISIGLDCNYILPEYRFYGTSAPDQLTKEDSDFWGLMNCEQASEDFHQIIEALKKTLGGRFCIEGCSKGGEAVAYQLAKHPEDGDLFIGQAAMVLLGNGDKDLYEYAYTTAGDLVYGKKAAKEMRDLITEFQIECLKNREELMPYYINHAGFVEAPFSPDLDYETMFDCQVLDQVYYWQYLFDNYIDGIKEALSMKDAKTGSERSSYISKLGDVLNMGYSSYQYTMYGKGREFQEKDIYNYMFQCFHEDGHYGYDFSYLRKAIKKSGTDAKLHVTEEMEKDLWDLRIDPSHRKLFPYDPSVLEARKQAVKNPSKPLIFINGLTDIYQTHEVKESDNGNVYIFNIPEACHVDADLEHLTSEQRKEFDKLVKKYMSN
ncbi:MAG: hypothetical protein J5715_09570 [Clostridiales bacterium]|nr:hypothetical protein [Clostridiales bacterium]